ncbi:MAG: ComF family protein [Acidobacteriota bacterium]
MSYENAVRSVLRAVVDTVWPDLCVSCRRPVEKPLELHVGLCMACRRRLLSAPVHKCCGCGVELPAAATVDPDRRCAACAHRPPPWRRLSWVWHYRSPLDAVVVGLKFRRLDYLAERLARPLASALEKSSDDLDAVVPVPLHWTRRLRRGYDQAALLAFGVGDLLGLPVVDGLIRSRRTPPQSKRDRSGRRRNLESAFRGRRSLKGRRVLLIDDVITTGATLESATGALLAAGVAEVDVAVLARTPEPGTMKNKALK